MKEEGTHLGGTGGLSTSKEMEEYFHKRLSEKGLADGFRSLYLDKPLTSKKEIDSMINNMAKIEEELREENES